MRRTAESALISRGSSSSLRSALCSRLKSVFKQYSCSSRLPPDGDDQSARARVNSQLGASLRLINALGGW